MFDLVSCRHGTGKDFASGNTRYFVKTWKFAKTCFFIEGGKCVYADACASATRKGGSGTQFHYFCSFPHIPGFKEEFSRTSGVGAVNKVMFVEFLDCWV